MAEEKVQTKDLDILGVKIKPIELILIGGFVVLIVIAMRKGVFKSDKGYETSEGNATDGSTQTIDDNTAKNIARQFREGLLGNNTSSTIFVNACNSLLQLNETDLIAVSNAYNNLYVNKEYNTLRSLLVQEWVWYSESVQKRDALLNKFNKIGI
jgi:hypothetical protein